MYICLYYLVDYKQSRKIIVSIASFDIFCAMMYLLMKSVLYHQQPLRMNGRNAFNRAGN